MAAGVLRCERVCVIKRNSPLHPAAREQAMRPTKLCRSLAGILLVLTAAVSGSAQFKTELFRGRAVAASEVLVRFKTISPNQLSQIEQAENIDRAELLGGVPRLYRFHSRGLSVAALVSHFRARPNVAYVEPNFIIHVGKVPNDPYFPQLWGLQNTGQTVFIFPGTPGADIGATAAWDVTTGSRANVVAVVDTGIDYAHPDLSANAWSAPAAYTFTLGGTTFTCAAGTHGFNVLTGACDPMD